MKKLKNIHPGEILMEEFLIPIKLINDHWCSYAHGSAFQLIFLY
jgi:hypothetical protein